MIRRKKAVTQSDLVDQAEALERQLGELRNRIYEGARELVFEINGPVELKRHEDGDGEFILSIENLMERHSLMDGDLVLHKGDTMYFKWNDRPVRISGLVIKAY